ncbi:MAG: nitroreductase family protein [Candidatus Thorarchaeota archaeon]
MKAQTRVEAADLFFRVIEERRSIRKYREFEIPDDDIARMFRAAQLAPSTNNSQPWRFIVVRTPVMKEILAEAAGGQKFIAKANAVVVVLAMQEASCCPNNPAKWHAMDTMIAAEHLILAATALGYGSCWIAMFQSAPNEVTRIVKDALAIPADGDIIALVTLGLADEDPRQRPRIDVGEIVYSEKYGTPFLDQGRLS